MCLPHPKVFQTSLPEERVLELCAQAQRTAGFLLYLGIQSKSSSQATPLSEETQETAERQEQEKRKGAGVWTMCKPWFIATFILP